MSIEAIDAVWGVRVEDSTRKLLLLAMADAARGRDGTGAYEAASTYAEKVECSERTVQRHITWLLERGRIREGDQSLAGHIPARHRPIVYDVAMTDAQASEWAASFDGGKRAASAAYGAKGGHAAQPVLKAKREAKRAAESRGDNLSPHSPGDAPTGDTRGVNVSPLTGDKKSPHLSPVDGDESGQDLAPRGDTRGDTRGDMGVTQTKEPTSYGSNQTQEPAPNGAGSSPGRPKASNDKTPEARVANAFFDHTKGMCNWPAIMGIAKTALLQRGTTEAQVARIMCDLHDAGRPITKQLVGQVLSGAVDTTGQRVNGRQRQAAQDATDWDNADTKFGKGFDR